MEGLCEQGYVKMPPVEEILASDLSERGILIKGSGLAVKAVPDHLAACGQGVCGSGSGW